MKPGTTKRLVLSGIILALLASGLIARGFSVPPSFSYQGRLTGSDHRPLDATVDLTFTFYSSADGATVLLTAQEQDIAVFQGLYKVDIGRGTVTPGVEDSIPALFQNHAEVWMSVTVGSDPTLAPRSRLTSVPYALAADKSFIANFWGTFSSSPDWDGDGRKKTTYGEADCNDWDAVVFPGAPELCDGKDNQCPGDAGFGQVDENCP